MDSAAFAIGQCETRLIANDRRECDNFAVCAPCIRPFASRGCASTFNHSTNDYKSALFGKARILVDFILHKCTILVSYYYMYYG